MAADRPTTVDAYIDEAPEAGRAHLRRVRAILREVAPEADEVMKWNAPFYVEPRFLFSFSAFKGHLAFAPSPEGLEPFRDALGEYASTKNYLKVRYDEPLPEGLIREIAERRVEAVGQRDDDGFW